MGSWSREFGGPSGRRHGFDAYLTAFRAAVNRLASAPMESQENGRRGLTGRRGCGMAVRHGTLRIDLRPGLARLCAVAGADPGPDGRFRHGNPARRRDARRQRRSARSRLALAHLLGASPTPTARIRCWSSPTLARPAFTLPAGRICRACRLRPRQRDQGRQSKHRRIARRDAAHFGRSPANQRHHRRRADRRRQRLARDLRARAQQRSGQAGLFQGAARRRDRRARGRLSHCLDLSRYGRRRHAGSGQGHRRRRQRARADEFDRLRRREGRRRQARRRQSQAIASPSSRSSW